MKLKIKIPMRQYKLNPKNEKRLNKTKDCTRGIQYYPKQANLPHPHRIQPFPIRQSLKLKILMRKHKLNP
jgi:hypothetical protein